LTTIAFCQAGLSILENDSRAKRNLHREKHSDRAAVADGNRRHRCRRSG